MWPELPDWPRNVRIGYTERGHRDSGNPDMGFNLATHVADDPDTVAANRRRLQAELPRSTEMVWINQVHGAQAVRATPGSLRTADAIWTDQARVGCAVLTADCLPIILATADGQRLAAVHAGWRSLAAGVIEAAMEAMTASGSELFAWLGPAISPAAFEVGSEVREVFLSSSPDGQRDSVAELFFPVTAKPEKYLADLRGLAEQRLRIAKVRRISGENACTLHEPARFFSHRREGPTGRMASFVFRLEES